MKRLLPLLLMAAGTGPLTLPPSKVKPARWVRKDPPRKLELEADASSPDLFLARLVIDQTDQLIAWSPGGGIQGPIMVPRGFINFIGTAGGAIYAADDKGSLWSAPDVKTALERGLAKVSTQKGQDFAWAVGGPVVAVATGLEVRVSLDGGKTFTSHTFAARPGFDPDDNLNGPVDQLLVRSDGLVLVVIEGEPWLSQDRGATWQKAALPLGPRQELFFRHEGDRIWADPSSERGCLQGELAADGVTWLAPGPPPPHRFDVDFVLEIHDRAVKGIQPYAAAPVSKGARLAREEIAACEKDREAYFRGRSGLGTGGHGGGLAASSQPGNDGTHGLLGDAAATTLTVGLKNAVILGPPPCPPGRLFSQRGVALLTCADRDAVFLADRSGRWLAAGSVPRAQEPFADLAADGTWLVAEGDPKVHDPRAFVRAPGPLGDGVVWREVTRPGTVLYRAVPGGRALAVRQGKEREHFSLELEGSTLLADFQGPGGRLHELRIAGQGIEVDGLGGTFILMADGTVAAPER